MTVISAVIVTVAGLVVLTRSPASWGERSLEGKRKKAGWDNDPLLKS